MHAIGTYLLGNAESMVELDLDLLPMLEHEETTIYAAAKQPQSKERESVEATETTKSTLVRSNVTSVAGPAYASKNRWNNVTGARVASKKTTQKAKPAPRKRRTGAFTRKGFKRQFANHNYHDRAGMTPADIADDELCHHPKSGVQKVFPSLLHAMLEDANSLGHADIISWQPHGRAFRIHDPARFAQEILPQYFHHQKLNSFQRQLSLYGFTRLTRSGMDHGAYYHEYFLRQRRFLCTKLQRKRVKGTWVRKSASPDSEPDFDAMIPVKDLEVLDDDGCTLQPQEEVQPRSDGDARFDRVGSLLRMEPSRGKVIAAATAVALSEQAQIRLGGLSRNSNHVPISASGWVDTSSDAIAIASRDRPNVMSTKDSLSVQSNSRGVVDGVPDPPIDMELDMDMELGFGLCAGLHDSKSENMYFGSDLGPLAI